MTVVSELMTRLDLRPHPEGGFYRETFRQSSGDGTRGSVAAIYYLLPEGHVSAWHRIDATEVWHFVGGDPLCLTLCSAGGSPHRIILGTDLKAEQCPHVAVAPWTWMKAVSLGAWTLVSCITVPAFEFHGFELAPPGWQPEQ